MKKDLAFQLNRFESPLPKDALCQVGWNWPSGSGEVDVQISSMYFHYLIILSPLGKGHGPLLKQTLIPFTQGCFLVNFNEIGPVLLKIWNVYHNDAIALAQVRLKCCPIGIFQRKHFAIID